MNGHIVKRSTALTTLALTTALTLVGCGTGAEESTETAPETAAPATSSAPATSTTSASPSGSAETIVAEHNDADVMFAQMMIPHHQQAVEMSEMLLAKDDIPANVRDFAQGVVEAQGPEIERMNAMLTAWDEEPMAESDGMEGMEGMDHGSSMDGMMSEEDMQQLEDAQGTEAARLYLEQMTVHHEGAVDMARDEVDNGENPQAVALAQQVIEDQEAEIQEMETMLQELPEQS